MKKRKAKIKDEQQGRQKLGAINSKVAAFLKKKLGKG